MSQKSRTGPDFLTGALAPSGFRRLSFVPAVKADVQPTVTGVHFITLNSPSQVVMPSGEPSSAPMAHAQSKSRPRTRELFKEDDIKLRWHAPMRPAVLSGLAPNPSSNPDDPLLVTVHHVKRALSGSKVIAPRHHARILKAINKRFRLGRQEDSHEFLRCLLDAMHESCLKPFKPKPPPDLAATTMINQIFGGKLRSRIKCVGVDYESSTYEDFMDLSLEITRAKSVLRALQHFTAKEVLDGDNKYRCPKNNKLVRAEKQITIEEAPNVLTIHLKRFQYGGFGSKITKPVTYESELNLQHFMSRQDTPLLYDLYGVLVHQGHTVHTGHYYCYVRAGNGAWHRCDDTTVGPCAERQALSQPAYILFYIRRHPKSQTPHIAAPSRPTAPSIGPQLPSLVAGASGSLPEERRLKRPRAVEQDGEKSVPNKLPTAKLRSTGIVDHTTSSPTTSPFSSQADMPTLDADAQPDPLSDPSSQQLSSLHAHTSRSIPITHSSLFRRASHQMKMGRLGRMRSSLDRALSWPKVLAAEEEQILQGDGFPSPLDANGNGVSAQRSQLGGLAVVAEREEAQRRGSHALATIRNGGEVAGATGKKTKRGAAAGEDKGQGHVSFAAEEPHNAKANGKMADVNLPAPAMRATNAALRLKQEEKHKHLHVHFNCNQIAEGGPASDPEPTIAPARAPRRAVQVTESVPQQQAVGAAAAELLRNGLSVAPARVAYGTFGGRGVATTGWEDADGDLANQARALTVSRDDTGKRDRDEWDAEYDRGKTKKIKLKDRAGSDLHSDGNAFQNFIEEKRGGSAVGRGMRREGGCGRGGGRGGEGRGRGWGDRGDRGGRGGGRGRGGGQGRFGADRGGRGFGGRGGGRGMQGGRGGRGSGGFRGGRSRGRGRF